MKFITIIAAALILLGCASTKTGTESGPVPGTPRETAQSQNTFKEKVIPLLLETKRTVRFSDGKTDEYTVSVYSADTLIQTETVYSASGSVQEITEFAYREDRLSAKTVKDGLNAVRSRTSFEYDGKGQLLKENTVDKDGKPLSTYEYVYNTAGNMTSRTFFAAGVKLASTSFTYQDGRVSGSETKNDAGAKISSAENTYDADGNLSGQKVYNAAGALTQLVTNVWKDGRRIRSELADGKGQLIRRETMEYGSTGELLKKSIEDIQGKSRQSIEYEYTSSVK